MANSAKNNKDKEMAAMLKKLGVERTQARCPICSVVVSIKGLQKHIVLHK